jgi:hypothetical protein
LIYLDTSVALAQIFSEPRRPLASFWAQALVSSRLLEYEVWNRIHAHRLAQSHGTQAQALIDRVTLIDLSPTVFIRALDPFPVAVRTLDGLHLATIDHIRSQGQLIELASYDARLVSAARALDISICVIESGVS